MNVSKSTLIYSIYIVISASFMRQVLNFIKKFIQNERMGIFIWVIFSLLIAFLLYTIIKQKLQLKKILLFIIIVSIGLYYTHTIDNAVERVHMVLFGTLGFLIAKDNIEKIWYKNFFYSILWCNFVVSLDEIFQYYLPYRVGDIRDIIFGIIGGLWGFILYYTITNV